MNKNFPSLKPKRGIKQKVAREDTTTPVARLRFFCTLELDLDCMGGPGTFRLDGLTRADMTGLIAIRAPKLLAREHP